MSGREPTHAAGDPQTVYRAFDQLTPMVAVFIGPEHVWAAGNAAVRAWIGDREFLGRPVREVFPEIAGQQVAEALDRVYAGGVPETVREWRVQLDIDLTDAVGEFFTDTTYAPLRDPDGEVHGITAVFTDVTERVRQHQVDQRRAADAERRYRAARDVVAELQEALLPPGLPVLPGVQIAASYLLADADNAAGGDWFDAVAMDDGRVALVVGDVVGHGVAASATMGKLRVVLHERLLATGDLVAAVEAVDRLAAAVPGGRAATVCAVALDARTGEFAYCTAGHPAPLLLSGDGEPRHLAPSGAGPLGVGSTFGSRTDVLGPGEMLLLYTDGILERPGREPTTSTVELARTAADAAADRIFRGEYASAADRLTTQTVELLTRSTGHSDDITLLAAARRTPVPALHLTLPAVPQAMAVAREAVDEWTTRLGTGETDRVALQHAVVELVTNAYEHAPPDPASAATGTVTVTADLTGDGQLRLTVADDGRWRDPDQPRTDQDRRDRGYGLAMTTALVDDITIDPAAHGTTVTVVRRASRPARLLTAQHRGAGHPVRVTATDTLRIVDHTDNGTNRIEVHGPLDAGTVDDLGELLDRLTRGGTRRLTVDLTGVTHLASAAVAELHRTSPSDVEQPLRLYAPAGTTAHHVLSLVNLPHTTSDPHAPPAPDPDDRD